MCARKAYKKSRCHDIFTKKLNTRNELSASFCTFNSPSRRSKRIGLICCCLGFNLFISVIFLESKVQKNRKLVAKRYPSVKRTKQVKWNGFIRFTFGERLVVKLQLMKLADFYNEHVLKKRSRLKIKEKRLEIKQKNLKIKRCT